jgi:hypothetical protein
MVTVLHTQHLPAGPIGLTTRFAGSGLVHRQGTASEFCTLEPFDGGFRFLALRHFDKSKAFGTAGVPVGNEIHLVYYTIRLKELPNVFLGGGIRQIANKDIHGYSLWEKCLLVSLAARDAERLLPVFSTQKKCGKKSQSHSIFDAIKQHYMCEYSIKMYL